MSAKELCAMLITRGVKSLTEEEEEVVVDYLESLGIETNIDDSTKDMCLTLLEKSMVSDLGKKVPLTAYANSLLVPKEKKTVLPKLNRKKEELELQAKEKTLPGCVPDKTGIFQNTLYDFVVNSEIGINTLSDNSLQYNAEVSINSSLYNNVFLNISNPILEITTTKGQKGYARINSIHNDNPLTIYISPLVGYILNVADAAEGQVRLCTHVPFIGKVDFTYYGEDKEQHLQSLQKKLPEVINAFSYLSLGMVLQTTVDGKEVQLRVERLYDVNNESIFLGILVPGESELPFEIV